MWCTTCRVLKTQDEFPSLELFPKCIHAQNRCIECRLPGKTTTPSKCPFEDCSTVLEPSVFAQLEAAWRGVNEFNAHVEFPVPEAEAAAAKKKAGKKKAPAAPSAGAGATGLPPVPSPDGTPDAIASITVTSLDGTSVPLRARLWSVEGTTALIGDLAAARGVGIACIHLLLGEAELELDQTLASQGVGPDATLSLMLVLASFGGNLNLVRFHLSWGYTTRTDDDGTMRADYLDGTCFAMEPFDAAAGKGKKAKVQYEYVDYRQRAMPGVLHSGDLLDHERQRGEHRIEVNLKKVLKNYTRLFFALSAYYSPDLTHYNTPTVQVFNAETGEDLCPEWSISSVGAAQAVVMCCLRRMPGGRWQVQALGTQARGNAKNYALMVGSMRSMKV